MGMFGLGTTEKSDSSSNYNPAVATDSAASSSGKNSPFGKDKAKVNAGNKAKFQEGGAVDLSNSKGNKFGADFSGIKGNVSFTNTGIDAESAFANSTSLAQTFSSTVKDLAEKQATALESILSNQSGPAAEASGAPSTPGEDTPETEEEAAARKKKITIGLALAALAVAAFFYFRK